MLPTKNNRGAVADPANRVFTVNNKFAIIKFRKDRRFFIFDYCREMENRLLLAHVWD